MSVPVTRFHFHRHNDVEAPDPSGTELHDLDAAKAHAIRMVRFEISETVKQTGRIVLSHRIDIETDEGELLSTVHFGDAVEIRP
jgi:hypothetical protein